MKVTDATRQHLFIERHVRDGWEIVNESGGQLWELVRGGRTDKKIQEVKNSPARIPLACEDWMMTKKTMFRAKRAPPKARPKKPSNPTEKINTPIEPVNAPLYPQAVAGKSLQPTPPLSDCRATLPFNCTTAVSAGAGSCASHAAHYEVAVMPASEVMHKWKTGQLHSGGPSGPAVTNLKQAVAIMLSEKAQGEAANGGVYPEGQAEMNEIEFAKLVFDPLFWPLVALGCALAIVPVFQIVMLCCGYSPYDMPPPPSPPYPEKKR